MTDYFALLEQPRRPWLDAEELRQTHRELTLATHPDRKGSTEPKKREADSFPYSFAAINEAYRVLSDPKLRLQHLLTLEGRTPNANRPVPIELSDLFAKIGDVVHEIDRVLEKLRDTSSVLGKSLLQSAIVDSQKCANELLEELRALNQNAVQDLREIDREWDNGSQETIARLTTLYHRFAYVGRWTDQVRERQFQLSV